MQMYIICRKSATGSVFEAVAKAVSLLYLKQEKNELEWMRELIRRIRRTKCAQIYAQLHMLWVNRAQKVSRATAGLTTDPMSIAMPIPPTFEATLSSFGRGRDLDALAC